MARVDTYDPQQINPGNISGGTINAIANTPTMGETIAKGLQPALEYATKAKQQRDQLQVMTAASELELQGQRRLQELQEQDLGDQDIVDVFQTEMKDRAKSVRETLPKNALYDFDVRMVGTSESLGKSALAAQAQQNANRVKNSSATFIQTLSNNVRTNPGNVVQYQQQLSDFVATMPVSGEAKSAFQTAAQDTVFSAHAESIGAVDPKGLWTLYQSGFYNDKVSPETLKQIQGIRDNAVQATTSRISLQAVNAQTLQDVDDLEAGLTELDGMANPVEMNTIREELARKRLDITADERAAMKSETRGLQMLAGEVSYDPDSAEDQKAVNMVYENRRNTLHEALKAELPPAATEQAMQQQAQAIDQAINVELPIQFVNQFKTLPESSINDLTRKLGDYRDKSAVAEGMQRIDMWRAINPHIEQYLPKGIKDDYQVYLDYKGKFGNAESALNVMIAAKTETPVVAQKREEKMLEAATAAQQTFNTGILRDSTFFATGEISRPLIEGTGIGAAIRFVDEALFKPISTPTGLMSETSSPDLDYMEERYHQRFTKLYMDYKGDTALAENVAKQEIQQSFGVSYVAGLPHMEGHLMFAPPEKIFELNGIRNYDGLFQSGDRDVVLDAISKELSFLQVPLRDATGRQLLDDAGNPRFETKPLPGGSKIDLREQPFRLRTTDYDRRNKSIGDFAKKPVYMVDVWDNGKWTAYPIEGEPMMIDFRNVVDALKKHRATQGKK